MGARLGTNPACVALAALALIAAVALLGGCGGSSGSSGSTASTAAHEAAQPVDSHGEAPAKARMGARAAAQEFLDALASRDADAFCEVALPELQRPNFADTHAPAGDCEERAEAMFGAKLEDGSEPSWLVLSQGKVDAVKLACPPGTDPCGRATVTIENLPLPEGGTTTAPTSLSFAGGRWRVGHYWVEVESETPSQRRRDPVAAAQGFLDSLTEQDAKAFCELTLPAAQQASFSSANVRSGGDCEERAQAMFDAPPGQDPEPLWTREARAVLGQINLHCVPGSEDCRTARIRIESLPLAGGGTTIAPMTIVFAHGRWLVGAIEPAPLGGASEAGAQA